MPSPLPPDLAEMVSARFRLLGEPMRLRILDCLRIGENSVGALAVELETSQQNVSKHLQVLYNAGVIDRRREGNSVIYRISDDGMVEMCDQVCGSMERQLNRISDALDSLRRG